MTSNTVDIQELIDRALLGIERANAIIEQADIAGNMEAKQLAIQAKEHAVNAWMYFEKSKIVD